MQSADNQTLKIISSIILVQGGILLYWIITSDNFFGSIGFATLSNVGVLSWGIAALVVISHAWKVESNGVRVKGQSKDGIEFSPHYIQFKSFAIGSAILLQTGFPKSCRSPGC